MAVYTEVSEEELQPILDAAGLGRLRSLEGIPRGVENSNHYLDTEAGAYVLTVIERQPPEALDYSWRLMAALAGQGFPCPQPVHPPVGDPWPSLQGKPTVIVSRLPGEHVDRATPAQCAAVGRMLAALHTADDLPPDGDVDQHGPGWRSRTAGHVRPELDEDAGRMLDTALGLASTLDGAELPGGVIHADVFRDNTLFIGDEATGLVDFHYAHRGPFLYDLAVAVNDFCRTGDDIGLDGERSAALLGAYATARPFTSPEREAWRSMLAVAASRFWLSRLYDLHHPRPGSVPVVKDPEEFRCILEDRLDTLRRSDAPQPGDLP